jgi:hypothetical protein
VEIKSGLVGGYVEVEINRDSCVALLRSRHYRRCWRREQSRSGRISAGVERRNLFLAGLKYLNPSGAMHTSPLRNMAVYISSTLFANKCNTTSSF